MNFQDASFVYSFILKFFSFTCLLFVLLLVVLEKWYVSKKKPSELEDGYNKLIFGYALLMGLPFLILSVGTLIQGIPSLLYLFLLSTGNLFSWAFFITVFAEYIILFVWIWFLNGANYLVSHPGLFILTKYSSPVGTKLFFTATTCGGIFAMIILWLVNFI